MLNSMELWGGPIFSALIVQMLGIGCWLELGFDKNWNLGIDELLMEIGEVSHYERKKIMHPNSKQAIVMQWAQLLSNLHAAAAAS